MRMFNLHQILRRMRTSIRRVYHPLIAFLCLWLLLTAINLIRTGHHWFVVAIATTIAFGFLLTFLAKYSYHGSLIMSICTLFFISLYIFQAFFIRTLVALPIVFVVSVAFLLLLHYLTRTRIVLSHYTVFFFAIAYLMTTLLAFYVEGIEAGTDKWIIFTSFFSIAFLLLVPLNSSFRENVIGGIINIADLGIYSRIAEELKTSTKSRSENELTEVDAEIEKIVSELISAVNSFLHGHYEGSVIYSYNVKEGLDRIFYHWMKIDSKLTFLEKEKEALDDWRQNIAHSNVSKPLTSSKRSEKERKRKKKLENRYIKELKTDYEKALNSIDFVMQAIKYVTKGMHFE